MGFSPAGETALIVYKLDHDGREVWQYPATVQERGPHHIRLEANFNRDDMDLGYVTFRRGDRFVETFYSDRWYNVFAVYDRDDGRIKGWYCNVCRPAAITESAVRCDDLALDLWFDADGTSLRLDEEEFTSLSLTPDERSRAQSAAVELERLAAENLLPG